MKKIKTHHRSLLAAFVAAAFLMVGGITTAQASIIGATPNTNFENSSVTFSFGDNATYTFSNDTSQYDQLSVKTGGSAQVSLLGTPPNVPHTPDGVGGAGTSLPTFQGILGPQNYSYDSFSSTTTVPTFQVYGPYIGLKFLLDGQVHYGYANIANLNTLVSYAYNSVADGGIVTGEPITPVSTAVPEPSSLGMFGLGLGLIALLGFGADRVMARRRSNEARGEPQRV